MSTSRSNTPKSPPRYTPRFFQSCTPKSMTQPSSSATARSSPISTPKSVISSPRTDPNTDMSASSPTSSVDNERQPKMTKFKQLMMICSPSSSQAITPRPINLIEPTSPHSETSISSGSSTPTSQSPLHDHTLALTSSENLSLTVASSTQETLSSQVVTSGEGAPTQIATSLQETTTTTTTTTVIVIPTTLADASSGSHSQGELAGSPTFYREEEKSSPIYTPITTEEESSSKDEKSPKKYNGSETDDGEVKRMKCFEVSFNLEAEVSNPNKETLSHHSMNTTTTSMATSSVESGETFRPLHSSATHQHHHGGNLISMDSATQVSVEEVSEEELPIEAGSGTVSNLAHEQYVSAANLDSIWDGFDSESREEIRKSLSDQLLRIEAVGALEKVSRVAQTSLNRLQRTVKEKDEVIYSLHAEIQSAYKAALTQREHDQRELEHLHEVFVATTHHQEHRTHAGEGVSHGVNSMNATLQRLEARGGLAAKVARLFDRYLHDLTSRHETHIGELQGNVKILRNRCEELDSALEFEKRKTIDGQAQLHSTLSDNITDSMRAKAQCEQLNQVVSVLQHQLNEKHKDLEAYGESVETLHGLLAEEKERGSGITDDYERMTGDVRITIGKMTAVNQQLKQLKQDTSKQHIQSRAAKTEVKILHERLKAQNQTIHKVSVELAAQRRKSFKAASKAADCKECRSHKETCSQEQQLLRDCVTALMAQVLELRDSPRVSTTGNGGARDGHATATSISTKHGNRNRLEQSKRNGTPFDHDCDHVFVPASSSGNDLSHCCHEYDATDKSSHSDSRCSHFFVPVEGVSHASRSDSTPSNQCLKRPRGSSTLSLEDAHSSPKRFQTDDKEIIDKELWSTVHGLISLDLLSPRDIVERALSLVENETMKKLEDHNKLAKKIEMLQKRLDGYKQAIRGSQTDLDRSDTTTLQLKTDLRNARGIITELETKLQKKADVKANAPPDNVRIKGLLDNIEMLEVERTLLNYDVMVQKNRQIARLETQLRTARAIAEQHEYRPSARSRSHGILEEEGTNEDRSAWEREKLDLQSAIASRDSQILELKFEADQAMWKLGQVEKRFQILFGALDCKKLEFDAPVADALLDDLFSSKKLDKPVLYLLKEKILPQRGFSRSGSREKELEGLVEGLIKVVEKVSNDKDNLQRTCADAVKYMEKNRELRKLVEQLQQKLAKGGRSSPKKLDPIQEAVIADLKSQITSLVEANAGLLKTTREMEEQCSGLKEMVHRGYTEDNSHMTREDILKFKKSRRICFSEAEHREQDSRLQIQTIHIEKLEQDLAIQSQIIRDLHRRLEMKEDELDFVHGKLSLELMDARCESIQPQENNDLWSFSQARKERPDDWNRAPEEYFDNQYLVEHEFDLLQEENRRLEKYVKARQNPELVQEIKHMKSEQKRLVKICDRYEELLRVYARQIGVPFSPLKI